MGPLVLFDGECNFCNGAVNFIIRNDARKVFQFAPMQSDIGGELRKRFGIGDEVDSIILIDGDKAYTHSTAALRITRRMGGIWPLTYGLVVIPAVVRDVLYGLFAKYRYRLFGRRDACMLPTPDIRERFLS